MLFHKDKNVLCLATKQETAKNMVTKVRFMYDNLPTWLKGGENKMAGLIEEFGIDLSNVEAPEYGAPADDIYEFTLASVSIQNGSKKNPDKSWIIFKYLLGDSGQSYSELFSLPADASNPTDAEINRLGYYKQRLVSLGVAPEDVNTVTEDELVGTTGTLELRTTKGRDGKDYQNIRNFKVASAEAKAPATKKAATAVDNPFA